MIKNTILFEKLDYTNMNLINNEIDNIYSEIKFQNSPEISDPVKFTNNPFVETGSFITSNQLDHIDRVIKKKIEEYFNFFNYKIKDKIIIFESWMTEINKDGFISKHQHNLNCISGVYYYKVNTNSGILRFYDLEENLDQQIPFYKDFIPFIENNETPYFDIVPENGLIVIFPGWMPHSVFSNKSNSIRHSISFNIDLRNLI